MCLNDVFSKFLDSMQSTMAAAKILIELNKTKCTLNKKIIFHFLILSKFHWIYVQKANLLNNKNLLSFKTQLVKNVKIRKLTWVHYIYDTKIFVITIGIVSINAIGAYWADPLHSSLSHVSQKDNDLSLQYCSADSGVDIQKRLTDNTGWPINWCATEIKNLNYFTFMSKGWEFEKKNCTCPRHLQLLWHIVHRYNQ